MGRKQKKYTKKNRKSRSKISIMPALLRVSARLAPFMLGAVLLFLVLKSAGYFLHNSNYFNIKEIEVKGGLQSGTRAGIAKELYSRKGNNIFTQDIKKCETDLERLYPQFKNIIVCRKLPDTLSVFYEQRKPACQLESGDYYLVSDDAVIISSPQPAPEPGLIIISGIRVPAEYGFKNASFQMSLERALGIVKDIDEYCSKYEYIDIDKIYVYDNDNPVIFLKNGTRIELGCHEFKDKAESLRRIMKELESKDKKAKAIDLRFDDIVVDPR
jgi:cell division septal protein FtsQ